MSEVRLSGFISRFNGRWGFARVPSQAPDWVTRKYFLHASKIIEGDPINERPCTFAVAPARYPGELEQALDVRISEGALILHHDDKASSGWRGCTAIIAIPDMCFNLERGADNRVTFSELRFRPTAPYTISVRVQFGDQYQYQVVESTLDTNNRVERVRSRKNKDADTIELARLEIEKNAKAGLPPLSQNKLMKLLGIKGGVERDRVLCANTKDDPRPWRLESGKTSLVVFV